LMRHLVRANVKIMIVFGFVDAHAPENDRRTVPVAANHASNVVNGDVLPRLVSDVLPSGDFFEDEQTDFIAGVEEVARLRIVRGADNVALQIVAKNHCVAALAAPGHGLSEPRESLMAV